MTLLRRQDGGYPTFKTWLDNIWEPGRSFGDDFPKSGNMPAVNIRETDKTYEIEVAAPGMDKKDFHVSVEDNVLIIEAEKKYEDEKKEDNYTRREFSYSSFQRAFSLPEDAKGDDIHASYDNGILLISLMKSKTTKKKKEIAIS